MLVLSGPNALRALAQQRLDIATIDGLVVNRQYVGGRSGGGVATETGTILQDRISGARDGSALKPAAVLVAVQAVEHELRVLLTVRQMGLANHPGQIALPGGRIDADDAGPLAAALREAREEIGLAPGHVEPLGYLDVLETGTGYRIIPVVALVSAEAVLTPASAEVAEIFSVPLNFLMDPSNHQRHSRLWQGRQQIVYAMPYGPYYIWGATAGILRNLYERLAGGVAE